jgi:cytochrome oxidase Cu insertion factor (SCO1/SenC/PrrC family)
MLDSATLPPARPNRKPLLALVGAFLLPVALAYLVLQLGLYQGGVLNRGELIANGETLAEKGGGEATGRWLLVFSVDSRCSDLCQQALHDLQAVWIALGREQERAEVRALGTTAPDLRANRSNLPLHFHRVSDNTLDYFNNALYIVDPNGNMVLRYEYQDAASVTEQSRSLLQDLRKLMKNSKIG